METITYYKLSRTHSGACNYLLIEQKKIIKFDHKNAVEYSVIDKTMRILPAYEVGDIEDNSDSAEQILLDYLKTDAMAEDNIATNKYSYFRIVLADRRDIVCKNFNDFIKQYKTT